MIVVLLFFIPMANLTQAEPLDDSRAGNKTGTPIIILTGIEVGEKTLVLKYKIKNGSDHDIWICDWEHFYGGLQFQVYLDQNNQTLFVHRRLDVLPEYEFRYHPYGRYVRLHVGEERHESLSFSLPVNVRLLYPAQQELQGTTFARHLVLEIGFYNGDMPGMIRKVLTEAERVSATELDRNLEINDKHYLGEQSLNVVYGGLLDFNMSNEGLMTRDLRSRDDELLIIYTDPPLKGGDVFQIKVDDLQIPCKKEKDWLQLRLPPLTGWSRIEIQFEPSMLEYFFPYADHQNLFTPSEIQYLSSLKTVVIKNPEQLRDFALEINKGKRGGIVAKRGTAHVTCYRDGEHLTSFTIYDSTSIETEEKQWLWYRLGLQSLKTLTPQIQPYELRVQCAANLKDLWHRLILYDRAEKRRLGDSSSNSMIKYPKPTEWSEELARAYRILSKVEEFIMRPYECPSAGVGECHYAMNPNCQPDSSPDMVLLFETQDGWNQHGGPELFTFDNHDPKGGCVLLNDGTVKFIRTKEELQQLRWK